MAASLPPARRGVYRARVYRGQTKVDAAIDLGRVSMTPDRP
jgi:hypothetical protein